MTIRFAPKNTYRDELELRGFPVDEKRYQEMVEIQQKREKEFTERKNGKTGECKQMKIKWKNK